MKKTQVSSIYLSYNNRRRMFLGKRMSTNKIIETNKH